jgi:hypothetical protein
VEGWGNQKRKIMPVRSIAYEITGCSVGRGNLSKQAPLFDKADDVIQGEDFHLRSGAERECSMPTLMVSAAQAVWTVKPVIAPITNERKKFSTVLRCIFFISFF